MKCWAFRLGAQVRSEFTRTFSGEGILVHKIHQKCISTFPHISSSHLPCGKEIFSTQFIISLRGNEILNKL